MATRLKKTILKLLKEDEEFRYAVAGLIGLEEILKRLDRHEAELTRLSEETNKLRQDMLEGFKRHDEEIAKLREDMMAGFKRHDEEIALLRKDMNRGFELLTRHLSAIGARWGIMAESAFREGMKSILEEAGLTVERWSAMDEKGIVYGYPSMVELDIAVKDGKTIVAEIKSNVRRSDVAEFNRKIEFYTATTGKKPDRKLLITPYAEEEALEAAKELEIEIYTKV